MKTHPPVSAAMHPIKRDILHALIGFAVTASVLLIAGVLPA